MKIIGLEATDFHFIHSKPKTNTDGLHCPSIVTPKTGHRLILKYISWDSGSGYGPRYDDEPREPSEIELDMYDADGNFFHWFAYITRHLINEYCTVDYARRTVLNATCLPTYYNDIDSEMVVKYIRYMEPNRHSMFLDRIAKEFDRIKYQLYSSAKALDTLLGPGSDQHLIDIRDDDQVHEFLTWLDRQIARPDEKTELLKGPYS